MTSALFPIFLSAALTTSWGEPAPSGRSAAVQDPAELFAETFDAHWDSLDKNYPYFELYGVDWDAERADHRPRAIAAADETEFAWELARLIGALPDSHVPFVPAPNTMIGKWSVPDIVVRTVEDRHFVTSWGACAPPEIPVAFQAGPLAYPELMTLCGERPVGSMSILAGGPLGTSFEIELRWQDEMLASHTLTRPVESNLPPPSKHFGENWLVAARIGNVGYLRIRTFSPSLATLGADGKITTMLRAALKKLKGTESIILDLQGNGGGMVAASDPFLGHLLNKRMTYAWGNAGGKKRIIRKQSPHYSQRIVAIVDERSASGGEWSARILRDAGRATVVGGKTSGAEAAVHESKGPDGSVVAYSAWPMIEPGITPFQETGIKVDHFLPLTISDVRQFGYDDALIRVRRARYAKALELLDAPLSALDRIVDCAAPSFD